MKTIITLPKEKINEIFEKSNQDIDVIIDLYKYLIPEWDKIKIVKSWPKVSRETWEYISLKIIAMLRKKNVLNASLTWMNYGFSCSEDSCFPSWEVDMSNVKLEME